MDANFFLNWAMEVSGFEREGELADYLSVQQGTLSGWRRRGLPRNYRDHIKKLCQDFNVPEPVEGGDPNLADKMWKLIESYSEMLNTLVERNEPDELNERRWLMEKIDELQSAITPRNGGTLPRKKVG